MLAKEDDERGYWRQMLQVARMVERFHGDPVYAKRNLEMRELQRKIKELGRAYNKDSEGHEAAYGEMETLTAQLFELKQIERRERLEELQIKIKELEDDIDDREKNKKDKIEEYLDSMIHVQVDL